MKVGFLLLAMLNLVALYYGAAKFFVTFAQVGESPAYFQGMEAMREFLWPSLRWLVGIAAANLVFAAILVFRRGPSAT
jgi:hypothetical protein